MTPLRRILPLFLWLLAGKLEASAQGWISHSGDPARFPQIEAGLPFSHAETDQGKEESFVDALTLGLRHSVTDAYVTIPGSDLALSARRNLESAIWNMRSGLRPHERPDRPFGVAWSSSLAPTVETVTAPNEPIYVYITDENGSSHRFIEWNDGTLDHYVPMPTSKGENSDYLTRFDGTTFTSRYGMRINFVDTGIAAIELSADRESGSDQGETHSFMRATSVIDRMGKRLDFAYSGKTAPDRSYGYDNAGRLVSVTEPAQNGKADVAYDYDALNRVVNETSGGVAHQYGYDLAGNRLSTVYGGAGRALVSTYDALNRL